MIILLGGEGNSRAAEQATVNRQQPELPGGQ
jgi:hypothetical protein